MSTKPILIYKLTPLQIALVDRIAAKENGLLMDAMDYSEIIAYQELSKLGFVNMHAAIRRRISIVLTETGIQACQWQHFKEARRARLTQPHIAALRLVAGNRLQFRDIPPIAVDVVRRMGLRGW